MLYYVDNMYFMKLKAEKYITVFIMIQNILGLFFNLTIL